VAVCHHLDDEHYQDGTFIAMHGIILSLPSISWAWHLDKTDSGSITFLQDERV
jgi:hypothetical protein